MLLLYCIKSINLPGKTQTSPIKLSTEVGLLVPSQCQEENQSCNTPAVTLSGEKHSEASTDS